MRITPLKKIIASNPRIGLVRVSGDKGFQIPSPMYEVVKDYFVKGEWDVVPNVATNLFELHVLRLEKEVEITINRPLVDQEVTKEAKAPEIAPQDATEPAKELQAVADKIFHVRLLHKPTGQISNTQILKRSEIPLFIDALIQKFPKTAPSAEFSVIRVSMDDKTIDIDSV